MKVGCARVSALEQNPDLQHDVLKPAGCDKKFTDHASGAKTERSALTEAKPPRSAPYLCHHPILLMSHHSPAYVQKQLGNHSISMTVDIYGHWIPGEGSKGLDEVFAAGPVVRKAVQNLI
jgi:hypothetical protein